MSFTIDRFQIVFNHGVEGDMTHNCPKTISGVLQLDMTSYKEDLWTLVRLLTT